MHYIHTYIHTITLAYITLHYIPTLYTRRYVSTYRQTDRRTDRNTYKQTNKQTNIHTYTHPPAYICVHMHIYIYIYMCVCKTDGQTEIHTNKQTNRQTYILTHTHLHISVYICIYIYVCVHEMFAAYINICIVNVDMSYLFSNIRESQRWLVIMVRHFNIIIIMLGTLRIVFSRFGFPSFGRWPAPSFMLDRTWTVSLQQLLPRCLGSAWLHSFDM